MKLIGCAVLDTKVGAYSPPIFFKSRGEAIRAFSDSVKDENIAFHKHPADYVFYFVGEFDDNQGVFVACSPERLLSGDEVG